jgi:hypothetical protein
MEVEGGRAVIVPEDRGDEDEDEDEEDGQEVNWTATDSQEGGMGRPGLAVGRVVGGKRPGRTTATGSQQPGERLNKHSNPSFPSPQVSRLPCAVPNSPRRTRTLDSGQWTPQRPDQRPDHTTLSSGEPTPSSQALYFATAICAVSLGVGSKLMGLVRFPSLTFFFLFSFLLFLYP